jgi:hypothetical protein
MMKIRQLLSVVALAAATVLGGAAGAPALAAGAAMGSPVQPGGQLTGPTPSLSGPFTTKLSNNWAGYSIKSTNGTKFNRVAAIWQVKPITCTAPDAWEIMWVGLDGDGSSTVEQGGSSARCVNGVPKYEMFWEMFPTNIVTPAFEIQPGNVSASVDYNATTRLFTIKLRGPNGESFDISQACDSRQVCDRVSAEWILESPGNRFWAIPNFGHVGVTSAVARDDTGHSGAMTTSQTWSRTQYQTEGLTFRYVTTGITSRNGLSFGLDWVHA